MELSESEISEYNALLKSASARVSDDVILGIDAVPSLGFWAKRRLRKSKAELERALDLYPLGWAAHWMLGKVHQRLGGHEQSLEHLGAAFDLNPAQPDVAREAGLEATESGKFEAAICFYLAALRGSPEDGGLHSNLAISRLLAGDVLAARESALRGAELSPADSASRNVLDLVTAVQAGERARPESVEDLR